MATVEDVLKRYKNTQNAYKSSSKTSPTGLINKYKSYLKDNSSTALKGIYDSLNAEYEYATGLGMPSWGKGSYEKAGEAVKKNQETVANLKSQLDLYKDYIDKDTYDSFSKSIASLETGYSTYLNNANIMQYFDSEDIYKQWYERESFINDYVTDPDKAKADHKYQPEWLSAAESKKLDVDAINDPEYKMYAQQGIHIENPNPADALPVKGIGAYDLNSGVGGMLRWDGVKNKATYAYVARKNGNKMALMDTEYMRYAHMTEDEVLKYSYYLAKYGEDKAEEYFDSLAPKINERLSGIYTKAVDDIGAAINSFTQTVNPSAPDATDSLKALYGFASGMKQYANGMVNFFNDEDYYHTDAVTLAGEKMKETLTTPYQVGYDLFSTVGNMFPSLMLSAIPVVGGAVSMASIGMSAAGNARAEMINAGYSDAEAGTYALIIGVLEAALQKALGGIKFGKGNGGLFEKLASKVLPKLNRAAYRVAVEIGANAFDEALEEGLQSVLEPLVKQAVTGDDYDIDWEEVGYSAMLGGLTGGIIEGSQTGVKTGVSSMQASNEFSTVESQKGLVSDALAVSPDSTHAKWAQSKLDQGKSLSGYQLNRLAVDTEEAIRTGDAKKISDSVKKRLLELGEGISFDSVTGKASINEVADAITKSLMGESLTVAEKRALNNSKNAYRVMTEADPGNVASGNLANKWAENIGTKRYNAGEYNIGTLKSAVAAALKEDEENTSATAEASAEAKIEVAESNKKNEGGIANTEIKGVEVNGDSATFTTTDGKALTRGSFNFASSNMDYVADAAVEKVSRVKGFTNEAATAMIKGYDDSISPMKYVNAFGEAFALGAKGIGFSEVRHVLNKNAISEKTAHVAYLLGQQSAENSKNGLKNESKNGTINKEKSEGKNESTESVRLRNGSKRNGSENSERQVSRVESGTGKAESRGEVRRIADSEAAALLNEGREVTVADLGIRGGSSEATVRVFSKSQETAEMKKARKAAEARGLKIKFIAGDNMLISEENGTYSAINGYILGDNIIVRVDHPLYTADQITRHEIGHDMVAKGEVDINKVRERLAKMLDPEDYQAVAEAYADAYRGTNLDANAIFEELICDSLGDMNIFAERNEATAAMFDSILPEIKKAASESKSSTQTRGSPEGKASRETEDLYTTTDAFKREVAYGDRQAFARSLANKTSDIAEGEIRTIYVNGYIFEADGYMHGHILAPYNQKTKKLLEVTRSEYRKINEDNEGASIWTKAIQDAERGSSSNSDVSRRGRSDFNDKLSRDSSKRNTARDNERVWKDSYSEKEIIELVKKVREIYGFDAPNIEKSGKVSRELDSQYSSPEEAKISGKVSDAKFSIEFADKIAENQRKFVADGLSRISTEELEQAIADTAHMVEEMKPYANILPQDKVGKTLVKNGSYDVSVENTTVCIRTLAYNSFVDMVSEKVGRPLTQMESFLVSQKLYEIAKEPQCLYCYVSLDRKAFNEMVIRYTEQRDAAISAYEEAGKPKIPKEFNENWSLFKDFLDGRKPTKNMWDRYTGWLEAYNKGERFVSLEDISTEAKRLELVEGGGEIASQVKDMLKYAQSASWAKKQTQYVAYYDEILKLKPAVIRNLNNHYGMRWYSFSDYSGAFIVENMQQITDAAIRGLKGLSYTKDTDFAEIFAPTGMNINISVYAKKAESGGYEIDAKQSANIDEAIKLREQYPNVGIVVVATDKAGVEWALAQEWSDVVIPFHTVRTGADVAEFYNWEIFNAEQSDTVADQNLWDAYVNDVGKKKASKMVYPSEHQNNRETYLSICEKRGLTPRFKSFLDNPNYMKLVNETRQSESQTSPLKAVYNLEAAERSFDKFVEKGGYYEGWYNDGIDVDGEAEIVAEDVLAGRKANEVSYGRQDISFDDVAKTRKTNRQHGKASRELDTAYISAVESGDMETAQRMVDEAAEEAGYDSDILYHGTTAFGFTEIDVSASDDKMSFFATDSIETAGTYSGQDAVKNIGSKTDSKIDIDDLDAEYRDKARDFISQINSVAGVYNFLDYRSNRFDEFVNSLLDGTDSYDNISNELNDYIEEIVSSLYDNASYYDSDLMPEAFYESEDVQAIYDASSELYDILKKIAEYDDGSTGNYQLYAKTEGLFEIDAKGNRWSKIPLGEYDASVQDDMVSTRQLAQYAKDKGYTGVKIKNVFDDGGRNIKHQTKPATVYIFFDPQAQVKSADPVTYDDNGDVIPLSERFNSKNNDIRYSRELEALEMMREGATEEEQKSISDREILASALESVTKNDIEKQKLEQYKSKIEQMNAEEKKLDGLKAQIKELSFAEGKRDTARIKELRAEAVKTENRINTYDRQLLNLESTTALKNLLAREKAKLRKDLNKRAAQSRKDALARAKEAAERREAALKADYQAAKARGIESRNKAEMRVKIRNFKQKLESALQHPTDNAYVPSGLAKAIIDVCLLIDTDTDLYKKDGSINKAQAKRDETKQKLINLRAEYEKIKASDDYVYTSEYEEEIDTYLAEITEKFKDKPLSDMSLDELREFYEIIRSVYETIQDAKKLIGWSEAIDVYEAGDEIAREQGDIAKNRDGKNRSIFKKGSDKLADLTISPVRNVERMSDYNGDSPLLKLFNEFEVGVREKNMFTMEATKLFNALTTGKNLKVYEDAVYKPFGEEYTDIDGRKFRVTKMQMMQAIMSYDRETANNMNHIQNGGFNFADLDKLKSGNVSEAISAEYSHRIMNADKLILDFIKALEGDTWAKEYMAIARTFFDEKAKDAVNDTFLQLKHRIVAKDKYYIPFEVDKNFVNREISGADAIQQTINSYGMLKETQKGAAQPLIITGLNNVIQRHIDMVGNVKGLAVPIRNFNKVWNAHTKGDGTVDSTVKAAIEKNWGKSGTSLITQTVQDLQSKRPDTQSQLYKTVKSGYIAGQFAFNISIVLKQIGSMFTASSMLNFKDPISMIGNLIYTMANHKEIAAEVDKYTATAWIRRQGLSDAELATLSTEGQKNSVTKLLNKLPSALNPTKWITGMDYMVALSLWKYAKQTVAKRTGLTGEELLVETAKYYDSVIENTQSMSDVLHRPEIQKRKDIISEAFGMFKTDLYQTAGQLRINLGRLIKNPTRANAAALAKTVYGATASMLWASVAINTLVAFLRYKVNPFRDDEDEITFESWLKRTAMGVAGDIFGYILPLAGGEIIDIVEDIIYDENGEAVDPVAISAINTLIDTMKTVISSTAEGEVEADEIIDLVAQVLQMCGVPANNIKRFVQAIKLHSEDIANGEFLSYEAGLDKPNRKRLYSAYISGDQERIEKASRLYKDESEIQAAIRKALRENDPRIKEAAEAKADGNFERYESIALSIELEGHFDRDDIKAAITSELNEITKEETPSDESVDKDEAVSWYNTADIHTAFEKGDNARAKKIIADIINNKVANGKTEKEAKSSIMKSMTSYWKPLYISAHDSKNSEEKARIKNILIDSGFYGGEYAVGEILRDWLKN